MTSSLIGRSLSLFLYLLILDGVAIFFFTRGFLLTRTELSMFSNCSDIAQCPSSCFQHSPPLSSAKQDVTKVSNASHVDESQNFDGGLNDGVLEQRGASDNNKQCWTRPAIKKAVILIIDALRFDFVAHSRNFDGERKPWMDKLDVLHRNVEERNTSARIFKFVADPPTTTLQRLKGLTTGGLPTFIDIGHSFGAPAILEDNLILQLAKTGKKVIVMGDDTWMQLFPVQFAEAYPFPSFNVKDLHTVDDGVIKELFPALHRDNWDVLIAHFLGVDHVGHIFGVESPLMPEKLEQYNKVIEDVIELLRSKSGPGGLFEDTLLIVMGDHGQTLNGDHGGGTPEEVESALFALGTHWLPASLFPNALPFLCELEDPVSGCISTFSQLDFSATMAAVLGVPFPFGSVGQVNADLFTLVAGNSDLLIQRSHEKENALFSALKLVERYHEVLCINSWQVKRYFEVYAISAITGFPPQDLARLEDLYAVAHNVPDHIKELHHLLRSTESVQAREEVIHKAMTAMREHVAAHGEYLSAAASLARSQWTQFGLEWMVVGFLILIACVAIRALALYRLCHSGSKDFEKLFPSRALLLGCLSSVYLTALMVVLHPILARTSFHTVYNNVNENLGIVFVGVMVAASLVSYFFTSFRGFSVQKTIHVFDGVQEGHVDQKLGSDNQLGQTDMRTMGTSLFVAIRALSLFSNSYIVAEGQVIHFLIASSGLLYLRSAIQAKSKIFQAVCFLSLIWVMPSIHTLTIFKGVVAGESQGISRGMVSGFLLQITLTCTTIIVPLGILSWLLNQKAKKYSMWGRGTLGVTVTYSLIGLHWLMTDLATGELLSIPGPVMQFTRLHLPRLIYTMSLLLTLTFSILGKFTTGGDQNVVSYRELVVSVGSALIAGSSGTVILLMGRKGPLLMMLAVLEVWVFLELQSVTTSSQRIKFNDNEKLELAEERKIKSSFGATVDWSLIATQLYYCTGHSCTFDGLHYSAAFIGFDDFGFYQQGVLLAMETFAASHVFPVIGLPLLVLGVFGSPAVQMPDERPIIQEITKSYLWFGLIQAFVACITTASVCIQRRHLMVWGIFAPKYVFDVVGFLLVDVLIILAASLYFCLQQRKVQNASESQNHQLRFSFMVGTMVMDESVI